MVKTQLTPCKAPWMISPSIGAVTLTHTETDVRPECSVVLGGVGRTEKGEPDSRRIEIEFGMCYHTRTLPLDGGGVHRIYPVEPRYEGDVNEYLDWLQREWMTTGLCSSPGFYVATESAWLAALGERYEGTHHYVVVGRDGYVELIAERYR